MHIDLVGPAIPHTRSGLKLIYLQFAHFDMTLTRTHAFTINGIVIFQKYLYLDQDIFSCENANIIYKL